MIYFASTLLNIIVYLVTFAVMWRAFRKHEADLETEYRLNFARVCTTFTDAMQSVAKALEAVDTVDTDDGDKESSNE
jgi:hypothetical protein